MKFIGILIICTILLSGCSSEKNNLVAEAKEPIIKEQAQKRIKAFSWGNAEHNDSDLTQTFTISEKIKDVMMVYEVRGEENKYGFLNKPLIKNKETNIEWLFWSLENEKPLGDLRIICTNLETKQKVIGEGKISEKKGPIQDLPSNYTTIPLNRYKTFAEDKKINGDIPASLASTTISFPQTGIWEIEVLVNEKTLGDIKVFVQNDEANIYYLND